MGPNRFADLLFKGIVYVSLLVEKKCASIDKAKALPIVRLKDAHDRDMRTD